MSDDDDEPPTLTIGLQALPPPGDMRTRTPHVIVHRRASLLASKTVEPPSRCRTSVDMPCHARRLAQAA
jgi:hypothetical protein